MAFVYFVPLVSVDSMVVMFVCLRLENIFELCQFDGLLK